MSYEKTMRPSSCQPRIVELRDGTWAAFDVKLAVITAGQYAYTLENGVHVIPLSVLQA
ncbi:MAG: hypothetical protein ACTIJ6_04025 [Leucobacter sp.]